ncbi:hypothetical protein [Pseudomonas sp. CBZ-4]|uniref:hypothetical protein n=1 Tax=Pseudomonas sp. CBZ-4 TaxID=1163065 RepID=UPI0015A5D1FC|nr:hypothetical protein [Pseudomonas sp. CBZ-4]
MNGLSPLSCWFFWTLRLSAFGRQPNDGGTWNAADQGAFVFDAQHIEKGEVERPGAGQAAGRKGWA